MKERVIEKENLYVSERESLSAQLSERKIKEKVCVQDRERDT